MGGREDPVCINMYICAFNTGTFSCFCLPKAAEHFLLLQTLSFLYSEKHLPLYPISSRTVGDFCLPSTLPLSLPALPFFPNPFLPFCRYGRGWRWACCCSGWGGRERRQRAGRNRQLPRRLAHARRPPRYPTDARSPAQRKLPGAPRYCHREIREPRQAPPRASALPKRGAAALKPVEGRTAPPLQTVECRSRATRAWRGVTPFTLYLPSRLPGARAAAVNRRAFQASSC